MDPSSARPEHDEGMDRVGFTPRMAAALIDGGIASVAMHAIVLVDVLFSQLLGFAFGVLSVGAGILLALAYGLQDVFLAGTVGKQVMRLAIARDDGRVADRLTLVKRWAVKHICLLFGGLAALLLYTSETMRELRWDVLDVLIGLAVFDTIVGAVLALFTIVGGLLVLKPPRQAFHDMLAGTAVFRSNAVMEEHGFHPLMEQPPPIPVRGVEEAAATNAGAVAGK